MYNRIKTGKLVACQGCIRQEMSRVNKVHGMSHTPFYNVWHSMRQRCTEPTHYAWKRYGGRGIFCCERWERFENFYEDMFPTYRHGLVLDRVDNDGPYSPQNCRWVTYKENSRNKQGVYRDVDVTKISLETGISKSTLYYRLQHGWPMELLQTPPNFRNKLPKGVERVQYEMMYSTSSTADQGTDSSAKGRNNQ